MSGESRHIKAIKDNIVLAQDPFKVLWSVTQAQAINDYATGFSDTELVSVSVANKILESPAVTAGNGPDDVPVPFAPSAVALKQLQNRRAQTTKAKH